MSPFSSLKHFRFAFHPLYSLLFVYTAGLVFGLHWHLPASILLGMVIFLLIVGICLLTKKHWGLPNLLFSVGIFLTGNLSINNYLCPDFPNHHIYYWAHNRRLRVEGVIYRSPQLFPEKTRLFIKSQYVWIYNKRFPATGNLLLTIRSCSKSLLRNDRVVFSARLRKPRNFGNSGSFNYARWLAFQYVYVTAYLSNDQNLIRLGAQKNMSFFKKIDIFRNHIRGAIDSKTSPPANLLLRALILGEKNAIPGDIRESFNRSGTAHVFAISGLHIGVVAAFTYFLLRQLFSLSERLLLIANVPKLSAFFALIPAFLYSMIAGASVSAQRAFIMVATYTVALIFDRERNLYHALALAALVILLIQPSSLFGASFQLSFISVFGILFFSPRLLSLLPKKEGPPQKLEYQLLEKAKYKIILFIVVSLSAIFATIPLVVYHFNLLSLSGIVANLIIVPIVGVFIVPLGLLGVVFLPFSSCLGGWFFCLSAVLSNIVIFAAKFFANLPWTNFLVPTPTFSEVALFYLFLLIVFL